MKKNFRASPNSFMSINQDEEHHLRIERAKDGERNLREREKFERERNLREREREREQPTRDYFKDFFGGKILLKVQRRGDYSH